MRKHLLTIFLLSIFSTSVFSQHKISVPLMDAIDEGIKNNTTVRALIMLEGQVDIAALDQQLYAQKATVHERAYIVITTLREKARETQDAIFSFLASKSSDEVAEFYGLWVANMIVVEAAPSLLFQLSERTDVAFLQLDGVLERDKPVSATPSRSIPNGVEPGVLAINAHKMWEAGYTGNGVIVMNIDTGVDGNHPAFNYKWRGTHVPTWQAWFDPNTNTTFPTDCDSHGSHTIGTMAGLEPATNDTIGVATGAEWIAAKTLCAGTHTSFSIAAFQWAMDPDSNASTIDDMPIAIGNSWWDPNITGSTQCDPAQNPYINVIAAVEAVGIAVVFSAGNSGPGTSTITRPKNVNTDEVHFWATGAVDGNNLIASFSSRGPVISQCITGVPSLDIKPEASAPGVSVRSAVLSGNYGLKSGTSMACPHVVGALALLKEAHPTRTGHELKMALYNTAFDLGPPGEDNAYGTGIIDVWAAHMSLADPEDPNDPENVTAYTDYATPSSILLTWIDPTTYVNGDTLINFTIEIYRDAAPAGLVPSGVETYTDTGLTDGQLYEYTVYSKDVNDSLSNGVLVSAIAGGAGQPNPPPNFYVVESGTEQNDLIMHWTNPSTNIDGTPMDDFVGINLYEDGSFVTTFSRTTADTSVVDSAFYTPPSGTHQYYVTAIDNEIPQNESDPSNSGFTPVSYPFSEGFEAGLGNFLNDPANGVDWTTTTNFFVGGVASALNAYGSNNVNIIELSGALDLTGATGAKLAFYQICKTEGNFDFGYVEYSTDGGATWASFPLSSYQGLGNYANERFHEDSYPLWGTTDVPPVNNWWQLEIFDLAAFIGETNFKIRFRLNTNGSVLRYGWLIDDVYIGPAIANPLMSVSPLVLEDTLLVGATRVHSVTVSNDQTQLSTLNYTVTESPPVSWLSIDAVSGTVASGQSEILNVTFDATSLTAANYTTELIVAGNDSINPEDTVAVTLQVSEAPIVGFSPDSISFALGLGGGDSLTMTILNTGAGPLTFTLTDEDVFTARVVRETTRKEKPYRVELSVDVPKGEEDKRDGASPVEGMGGPDNFGYVWIDSDEPGGPTFNWQDITGTGTPVTLMDDDFIEVPLPFTFSFYGVDKNSVKIVSNGFLNLGIGAINFTNAPIPDPAIPNDIICPFWDDLNPADGGTIHYFGSQAEFTVQYTDVPHYSGAGVLGLYTFQVILNRNGTMLYQYLDMRQTITSATIGIENTDASDGLEIVFNAPYMHDSLAIRIASESVWLSENPNSGTVPPGGSMDVQVIANSTGLTGGDYLARVIINSNDPITPDTSIPVRMTVGGIPIIAVTPDSLWFDSLLVGLSVTLPIDVANVGSFPLNVSNVTSSSPAFSVDTTSFVVPPLTSHAVNVTFAPPSSGFFGGQLLVASDDPDTPVDRVYVHGQGLEPPVIAVTPDSLIASLPVGATTSIDTLTISNTGAGSLIWSISEEPSSSPPIIGDTLQYHRAGPELPKGSDDGHSTGPITEGMGGPDGFGYRWIDSDEQGVPSFSWVDISGTGTALDSASGWIPTGTFRPGDEGYFPVTLPFSFSYYGSSYDTLFIGTNGNCSFQPPTSNAFTNEMFPTAGGRIDNHMGIFWDDLEVRAGALVYYGANSNDFVVQYQGMPRFNQNVPDYIFELIIRPTGEWMYQYLAMGISGGTVTSTSIGMENVDGTIGLSVVHNATYVHDSLAIKFSRGISWLDVSPTSGTVALGDSQVVTVTFNSMALPAGVYTGTLNVASNDPANPTLAIPVRLDVGTVDVSEARKGIPTTFELSQNYPNPFNPATRIEFALPVEAQVSLRIYNLLGQEVITLLDEQRPAGYFAVEWNGKATFGTTVSSGIYFYRLEAAAIDGAGEFAKLKKMILLK